MVRTILLGMILMAGSSAAQVPPPDALARQLEETRAQLLRQQMEAARVRQVLETTRYQQRLELARREWFDGRVARAQVLLDACPEGQRGFEWHFLEQLLRGSRVTGFSVGETGLGIGFRPGDETVLLVSGSGVYAWDVGPGQEQLVAVPPRRITAPLSSIRRAARSLDGNIAAIAADGSEVTLVDLRTGKELYKVTAPAFPIQDLAFSRDGRRLAVLAMDSIVVWDVQDRHEVFGTSLVRNGAVCLDIGPTGDTLAVGSHDGMVVVWDLEDGAAVLKLQQPTAPSRIRFSPQGNRLAILAGERLRLWNLAQNPPRGLEPAGNPTGITTFNWSPDGARLAAGAGMVVLVWDATGRELLETHRGHTDRVRHVAYGAEARRLASLGDDGILKVWDVPGHPAGTLFRAHGQGINSLAWSPDGRVLATASQDRSVKLWDVSTHHVTRTLGVHPGAVTSLSYSPDGKQIATGCDDAVIRIWDAESGKPLDNLSGFRTRITSVAYSPDNRYLAAIAQDGVLQIQTRAGGKARGVKLPGAGFFGLAFKPDGSQLAVACSDLSDVAVRLFDPATLRELELLKGLRAQQAIAWSPDAKQLAFASSTGTRILNRPLEARRELVLRDVAGTFDQATSLAFSPDGTRLATTGIGQPVRIWDTTTGLELIASPESISGGVLAFDPSGSRLALGDVTGHIRIFEAVPRSFPRAYLDSSYHLAFSPDGQWMVTGLRQPEHLLQLWDLKNQRKGPVLDTIGGGLLSQRLFFSDDSAYVRTLQEQRDGGKSKFLVRFWDVKTGREAGRNVIDPEGPAAHWHWNGTQLAVASVPEPGKPYSIRIWDALTGKPSRVLADVGARMSSLRLSPEGARLLVTSLTSQDGTPVSQTSVWDLASGKRHPSPLESALPPGVVLSRLVFSQDGKAIACYATRGNAQSELVLLDTGTMKVTRQVPIPRAEGPLAFSPDGKFVILPVGPLMRIIPTGGGMEMEQAASPYLPFQIDQVVFTADGKHMAVQGNLSRSSRVYLWDFPPPPAPDRAKARQLDPIRANLFHRLEASRAQLDHAWYTTVFHLDRLILQQPDQGELYRLRGRAFVGLGLYDRAVPDLARAIQGNITGIGNGLTAKDWKDLQPVIEGGLVKAADSWPLLALHGHALAGQGHWPQAVQSFARAVKQGGEQIVVLDRYAFAALGAEDPLLYRRVCGQVLDAFTEPKDATSANNIAWACLLGREGGKHDRALLLARRAVEAATFAPAETRHAYLNTLALALYRTNKLEEAERTVQAAIEVNTGKPSRLDHLLLALIRGQLGKKELARVSLSQAIQGSTDDPVLLGSWELRLELAILKSEAELVLGQ